MSVIVTVTQPAVTVTATSSSSGDALPAGSIAGIVIGTLFGFVLFAALVFYLLTRYRRHKFTRVANPVSTSAGTLDLPRINSQTSIHFIRHSQKPSVSSEPLISPVSWPPIPPTSWVHSSGTSPRPDSVSPGIRDSQYTIGEITQVTASGTVSSAAPAILNIPPAPKPEQTPSPPTPQQTFFIHRMLQSRAQASEGVSLVHHPSLDFPQSRSTTLDSSADEERLLADAERTALRDAEMAQRDEERIRPEEEEEEDWEEVASSESMYSQLSAPLDHSSSFLDPVSRQNSVHRQKSSRRQRRTTELTPVAEVPDAPMVLEGRSDSCPVSIVANPSLDGQISHGTASRPMSSVFDHSGTLPLLTSANFGKDSTTSGTTANSISSTADSSGRASRYPSLASSSIGQSSQSGPRSDGGTDWHHPPPGLSGLKTLQIGPLRNPYSPVEEQPGQPDASLVPCPGDPAPAKRAHLREGTVSSIPEVERRTVMQGGIACIDVAL